MVVLLSPPRYLVYVVPPIQNSDWPGVVPERELCLLLGPFRCFLDWLWKEISEGFAPVLFRVSSVWGCFDSGGTWCLGASSESASRLADRFPNRASAMASTATPSTIS